MDSIFCFYLVATAQSNPKNVAFVAVHVGAGFHSVQKTGAYRILCDEICVEVMGMLNSGCEARKAVAHAVALLENSPLTNAGIGSNLTLDEKVECDASIMDNYGFGSVGALSNIKNPIMVALSLLDAQSNGHLSYGRVAPCMLVGDGAKAWARDHNIQTVNDDLLKTETSLKIHQTYMRKMKEAEATRQDQTNANKQLNSLAINDPSTNHVPLDTVGAIVFDTNGNFASAASSGGILLKHPGRIGHASMYGCGCWVDEHVNELDPNVKHSIAICTTGCGEHIIKTLFAKECADYMIFNNETDVNYLNRFFQTNVFKFFALHTTASMCYGYMTSKMTKAVSIMSRLPDQTMKNTVAINNHRFRMDIDETVCGVVYDMNEHTGDNDGLDEDNDESHEHVEDYTSDLNGNAQKNPKKQCE